MSTVGYVVIGALVLSSCWMLWIYYRAQKLKGDRLPPFNAEIDAKIQQHKRVIIYFYTPNCGQCYAMTPLIQSLERQNENIISFDLSKHNDVALKLNIRATPTIMVLTEGVVSNVFLGSKTESFIEGLLAA